MAHIPLTREFIVQAARNHIEQRGGGKVRPCTLRSELCCDPSRGYYCHQSSVPYVPFASRDSL